MSSKFRWVVCFYCCCYTQNDKANESDCIGWKEQASKQKNGRHFSEGTNIRVCTSRHSRNRLYVCVAECMCASSVLQWNMERIYHIRNGARVKMKINQQKNLKTSSSKKKWNNTKKDAHTHTHPLCRCLFCRIPCYSFIIKCTVIYANVYVCYS